MDPAVAVALINGGSSLLGGLANASSTSSANAANLGMFKMQMAQNAFMYQDSKNYNSAVSQANRLRSAGINPAFALGSMNAGTISGQSSPSGNPQQPVDYSPFTSLLGQIPLVQAQVKNLESGSEKQSAEAEGVKTDNLYRSEHWLKQFGFLDAETGLKKNLAQAAGLDAQYQRLSMANRLKQLEKSIEMQDAQIVAQDITNQFLPSQLAESCAVMISQQFHNYATGKSSLKEASAAIMNAMNNQHAFDAQYGGNPEDRSRFFNATLDGLIQLKDTRKSEEYKNVGSFVPFSRNLHHFDTYNDWSVDKRQRTSRW